MQAWQGERTNDPGAAAQDDEGELLWGRIRRDSGAGAGSSGKGCGGNRRGESGVRFASAGAASLVWEEWAESMLDDQPDIPDIILYGLQF